MKNAKGLSALVLGAFFCTVVVSASWTQFHKFEINGFAQGTTYHVLYFAKDSAAATRKQLDSIFAVLDSSLSIYKPYSLINRFNGSASGIEVDEHLRIVVEKSLAIFEDSGGVFDITIYPIVQAWGFGKERVVIMPDSNAIRTLMTCVGSEKIYLKNAFIGKKIPCVQIDVNGIAQGYSVDVIAGFLERRGIKDYLVEVGGELRVKGTRHPDGQPMRIGIESPWPGKNGEALMQKIIELPEGAVTTSGNYQKQYKSGNKTISHLMNPKTGYTIDNDMISATVIASDAMTADGYDNVLMGLGAKGAMDFMYHHPGLEAYLIFRKPDGTIGDIATPGFSKMIKTQDQYAKE